MRRPACAMLVVAVQYVRATQAIHVRRALVPHSLTSDEETYVSLSPLLHVGAELRIAPDFYLGADARGGIFGVRWTAREWGNVQFVSLDLDVRWRPFPWFELALGGAYFGLRHRYAGREVDDDRGDNRLDVRGFGPYVSFTLRF